MSELYSVYIDEVGEDYVDLDVTVVHPDAGGVSEGVCFALMLLFDPIDEYSYGREQSVKESPLAQEMDLDKYLSEAFIRQNALGFVSSSEIIREHNHPPPYWGDDNYEEFWDSGERSSAVLRIRPTHPGWIAHMRQGMSWDTAAYDCGSPEPWDRPTRRPGDKVRQVSDDPMAGMREAKVTEKNASMLRDADVEEFTLPLHGAKSYQFKESLTGDAITAESVRALLGQPVLVQSSRGRLEIGALIKFNEGDWISVYHESSNGNSYGTSGVGLNEIEEIGRAWYVEEQWVDELEV